MAVLKVKGSILKLVDNSPHSDWITYEHLTTLSVLRQCESGQNRGNDSFVPYRTTALLDDGSCCGVPEVWFWFMGLVGWWSNKLVNGICARARGHCAPLGRVHYS